MNKLPNAIGEFFALPPATHCNAHELTADTAETVAVPAGAKYALFASTGDFFVDFAKQAQVPGDVSDGSAAELNPTMRYLSGVKNLSLVAPGDCTVTISYYG